jgi:hypothetical protein
MATVEYKGNRKAVTDWICARLADIEGVSVDKSINAKLTREQLEGISQKEFDDLMEDYFAETECPVIYAPNNGPVQLNTKRNIKLAESMGHDFMQHLVIGSDDPNEPTYVTPPKYFVLDLPWRRQAQVGMLGISVPSHHNTVDARTGAVTGDSASAKLSGAEANLYQAMGMQKTLYELLNVRGGDEGSRRAMETEISRTGSASIATIEKFSTGVGVVSAMKSMLTAMHMNNTL